MSGRHEKTASVMGLKCPESHEVPDACVTSTRRHYYCPECGLTLRLNETQKGRVERYDREREHDV